MRKTANYELNIAEGSDRYNHLTIDNPNYEKIDTTMKENEDSAVQTATELKSGTVHAITRNKPNASMFRFVATSDFTSGETFTVDGQQVTAMLPNGATLGTGAYHINANVLCCLVGTNMTVYTIGVAENVDASTLEGHSADYFATADALNDVRQTATSAGVVANNASNAANNAINIATKNASKIIWKNPSTDSFSAQTINVELDREANYIIGFGRNYNGQHYTMCAPFFVDNLKHSIMYFAGDVYLYRSYTANSNGTVIFSDSAESNGYVNNNNIIPIVIYKL